MQHQSPARRLSFVETDTAKAVNDPGGAAPRPASEVDLAVAALFREHHVELVRLALLMVGDLATAEDVVQDAFEHLHRRWHRLREPGAGLAYARSTVMNGCRSVHRRSAVARKHAPRLAGPVIYSPDAATGLAEHGELVTALRSLSRRQREVLVLRFYADLDAAEIAATLRISASTVRSTTSRGLAELARLLERAGR